jgi:hypothetical protein
MVSQHIHFASKRSSHIRLAPFAKLRNNAAAVESPGVLASRELDGAVAALRSEARDAKAEPDVAWGQPDVSDTHLDDSTSLSEEQLVAAVAQFIGPSGAWALDEEGSNLEGPGETTQDPEDGLVEEFEDVWQQAAPESAPRQVSVVTHSDAPSDVRALKAMNALQATTAPKRRGRPAARTPGRSAASDVSLSVGDGVAQAESYECNELLPALEELPSLPAHRSSCEAPAHLDAINATSKFRERFDAFKEQLRAWGYFAGPSSTRPVLPKNALASFARANPDLLYALPVRDLHIFSKKFKAFPCRDLIRKVRAASQRLFNRYTDFHYEPTFNGHPTFQDVTRLLLFVSMSDFPMIEKIAPGIVAAASELLPSIIVAASVPPQPADSRLQHSREWHAMCEDAELQTAKLDGFRRPPERRMRPLARLRCGSAFVCWVFRMKVQGYHCAAMGNAIRAPIVSSEFDLGGGPWESKCEWARP